MAKRLERSKSERMIGGVCGGMGEYFNVDPVVIRLIFVAVTLFGGAGILAYIILWIVLPEEGGKSYAEDVRSGTREKDKKKKEEKFKKTGEKFGDEVKESVKSMRTTRREDGRLIFAAILIVLGLIFLANNFIPYFSIIKLWPILVVIAGLIILFGGAEKE